jgi:hypothetical protein
MIKKGVRVGPPPESPQLVNPCEAISGAIPTSSQGSVWKCSSLHAKTLGFGQCIWIDVQRHRDAKADWKCTRRTRIVSTARGKFDIEKYTPRTRRFLHRHALLWIPSPRWSGLGEQDTVAVNGPLVDFQDLDCGRSWTGWKTESLLQKKRLALTV